MRRFFPQVRFCRRQRVTPHPPRCGPPVSLRLGHTRALSLPRSEIHSPRAASLPARRRQRCGAEGEIVDGRSTGEGGARVVGSADPYRARSESRYEDERSVGKRTHSSSTAPRSPFSSRRRQERVGYKYAFSGGRRWQPTLTDEAFVLRVRFCCKVPHYSSSIATRSPFSDRRRQGCGAEVDMPDGRSAGKKAHSSSTAPRSPFSSRRRQERAGYKYAFSGGRRWQPTADG